MKIFAYEVRKDEIAAFSAAAAKYHVDITTSTLVPTPENAGLAAGCGGVTILGQGHIDRHLLERYHALGIRCLSTRTIGSNHIDLQAARELGIQVCSANYPPNGVADFTVMMILMCLRQYKQAMWRGQVNDFSLEGLQGRDMKSLTIGILGTGAQAASAYRCCGSFPALAAVCWPGPGTKPRRRFPTPSTPIWTRSCAPVTSSVYICPSQRPPTI